MFNFVFVLSFKKICCEKHYTEPFFNLFSKSDKILMQKNVFENLLKVILV